MEEAAAKERQREGGRSGGKAGGKLPQASKGKAADKAAKATGKKRRTLEKVGSIGSRADPMPWSLVAARLRLRRFAHELADTALGEVCYHGSICREGQKSTLFLPSPT
jgi:hypothetical protein